MILFSIPFLFLSVDSAFASPTVESSGFGTITDATAATNTLIISPVSIGTQSDRLLVVNVALDRHFVSALTVTSVTYNGTGSCTTSQSFTQIVTVNGVETRNEMWYLTAPVSSSTCSIYIKLSDNVGNIGGAFDDTSVTAGFVFFSGVDQTTPIDGTFTNTAIANSATPSVSVLNPPTNTDHYVLDIMSTRASVTVGNPTAGANQLSRFTSRDAGVFSPFSAGSSVQLGGSDDVMSWSLGAAGQWASSVIVIRSCSLSSCTPISTTETNGGGCSGDCTPPTLGLDRNSKRIVSEGFSFNGNPIDVNLYYTPYPLIITNVGQENTLVLKIHDNSGPQNIAHIEVAFGLEHGESFNDSHAIIIWDRTFDGKETLTFHDPENIFENVKTVTEESQCTLITSQCMTITFYHTFRAPLDSNMVSTNIWDYDRNAWQNYFNHGIQITGESMNPAIQHTGIYQGHIYHLTETEKNNAVDNFGNTWTLKYGLWEQDFISIKKNDSESMNYNKIQAIKYVLKDKSLNDISESFGYDNRNNDSFVINKNNQTLIAESLMDELCPKCTDEPFDKINNIFYYQIPERIQRSDNLELHTEMKNQAEIASKIMRGTLRDTDHEISYD